MARLEVAISAALCSFDALKDVLDPEEGASGIGHNDPPEDDRLLKEDFEAVAQELRETLKHPQDESSLKQLVNITSARPPNRRFDSVR